MFKIIIIALLSISVFIISMKNIKNGIKLMVFSLPFVFQPFIIDKFPLSLSINCFIIISVWLAVKAQKNLQYNMQSRINFKSVLIMLLLYGILLPLLSQHTYSNFLFEHRFNLFQTVFNFSLFIIIIVLFIDIMLGVRNDYQFQDQLLKIFILTVFLHIANNLLLLLNQKAITNYYSSYSTDSGSIINRYSGLLNDYELVVDYSMMIFAFSLYFIASGFRKYVLPALSALTVGLLSGTRSFLVILIIFVFTSFSNSLIIKERKKVITRLSFLLVLVSILGGFAIFNTIKTMPIITRFYDAVEFVEANKIEQGINRPFTNTITTVYDNAGIWGRGSLIVSSLDHDAFVYHSLYLSTYINYGAVGIILLLMLYFYLFRMLVTVLRSTKNKMILLKATIYLSLLIALVVQQYKITAHREISVLLIYAYFIVNIYFVWFHAKNE